MEESSEKFHGWLDRFMIVMVISLLVGLAVSQLSDGAKTAANNIGRVEFFKVDKNIGRIESFDGVQLGMRDVDVTLHYGQRPKCEQEDLMEKVWGYPLSSEPDPRKICYLMGHDYPYGSASPPDLAIYLTRRPSDTFSDTFAVAKICSSIAVPDARFKDGMTEQELVQLLGQPTSSTVIDNGTAKTSYFKDQNILVDIRRSVVERWCVTDSA